MLVRKTIRLAALASLTCLLGSCAGGALVSQTRAHYYENLADESFAKYYDVNAEAKQLYCKAIDQYNSAIRYIPKDAQLFYHRAWCRLRVKDRTGALADFTEAIALAPNEPDAWHGRATLWHDMQVYDKQLEDETEVCKLSPSEPNGFWGKAEAEHALGHTQACIADYTQAIKLAPDARAYAFRAGAYLTSGNLKAMQKDFEHAIQLDPHDWEIYWMRSHSEFALANYNKALDDLQIMLHGSEFSSPYTPYALIQSILAARFTSQAKVEKLLFQEATEKLKLQLTASGKGKDTLLSVDWPNPIIQFLNGTYTERQVMTAAGDDLGRRTEALCYLAYSDLQRGDLEKAKEKFLWVAQHGDKSFDEYEYSQFMLKRLPKTET